MNLIELGAVLGDFFENGEGPSHNELDIAFERAGLKAGDPAPGGKSSAGSPLGKTKRIRQALAYATDHDPAAGLKFSRQLVDSIRADGMFEQSLDKYVGETKIVLLRKAFARIGYTLGTTGALVPTVIDNLEGTELSEALRAYVARINLNPDDAALQVGTGKELDEAAARHVLIERTGSYETSGRAGSFPVTLAQAFTALDLEIPPSEINKLLSADPRRQVHQCLFLLGAAVNRLRNDAGTGHGRPDSPRRSSPISQAEARMVSRATALLAGLLIDGI